MLGRDDTPTMLKFRHTHSRIFSMTDPNFLPPLTLIKLQTVYSNLPEHTQIPDGISPFKPSFSDFLQLVGNDCELQAGQILFREDNLGDNVYWIESGVLAVLQGNLEDPLLLTFRYPGQVVGEIALLENIPRTATVAAVAQSRLKFMSNEKFQELLSSIPVVGLELMRMLSARLREVRPAEYSAGMYDYLTGALSRQSFDARLGEEIQRARSYQYNFSLVFLDIDNFKSVNDNYGHTRGDEVLITFAKRIMSDLRTTDMLFRYGGDEFVLILQGIDKSRGPILVNRLLYDLRATPFPGDPPVTLSFSAGLAYFPHDAETPEDLLRIADERAYLSKQSGRAKVTGPLHPPVS